MATYRFECGQCGDCCREHGLYPATSGDIMRISRHLGISAGTFIDKYCKLATNDGRHGMFIAGSPCPFMKDDICSIHEVKPLVCRVFPDPDGYVTGKRMKDGLRATTGVTGLSRCAARYVADDAVLEGDIELTARFHIAEDTDRRYFASHEDITEAIVKTLATLIEMRTQDAEIFSLMKDKVEWLRQYHLGHQVEWSRLVETERMILHRYSSTAASLEGLSVKTLTVNGVRAAHVKGEPGIWLMINDALPENIAGHGWHYKRYGDTGVFSISLLSDKTAYIASFTIETPCLEDICRDKKLKLKIKLKKGVQQGTDVICP